MRPQVPHELPHAMPCKHVNDYLHLGTYGGGADHFTHLGPGIYGFNWWYNGFSPQQDGRLLFPELPKDLIFAFGVRGHIACFSPKRNYAVVTSFGNWEDRGSYLGNYESKLKRFIDHMERIYK